MAEKIKCSVGFGNINEAERLELCRLLIKAGYSVSVKRERNGNKYIYYIEIKETE
jgi:hypothetical protein